MIDGLVEIDANDVDTAENIIKNKIENFIKDNAKFFEDVGAKAVQGQAYLLVLTKKKNREVQMSNYKNIILLNTFIIILGFMRHHLILKEKFMDNLKLYQRIYKI